MRRSRGEDLDYSYPDVLSARPSPSRMDTLIAAVVVCIVAFVALTALRRQSELARAVHCAGNLRQIGVALMIYAQDNDDEFPNRLTGWPAATTVWQRQEQYTWRAAIRPYMNSGRQSDARSAFRCLSNPMNDNPTGCQTTPCGSVRVGDGFSISYACNFIPAGPTPGGVSLGFCGDKNGTPVSLKSLQNSAGMIAIVEDELPWSEFDVIRTAFQGQLFTGHNGASNYLFADGHATHMLPAATLRPANLWVNGEAPFTPADLAAARGVLGVQQ